MDEMTVRRVLATAEIALGDIIAYGEQEEIPAPMRLAMMMSLARAVVRIMAEAKSGGAA